MNTLKNHIILYDSECPMCNLYTNAFTTSGMLDKEGRAPYQQMPEFACPLVDRERAVNEIALVDKQTGEVSYGIESLFKVIANAFPIFKPLFHCRPFSWIMRRVYAFISYNRKVIIPAPQTHDHSLQPAFRLRYRLAWLLFTLLVAGSILTAYAHLLVGLVPLGNPYREYAICTGQILFQGAIISRQPPRLRWDYLGNMMTISFAGALLLLPMLGIAALTPVSPLVATAWFLLVAALMLLEHLRRTKLLSLGYGPTVSWAFYRLALLGIILN